jgi:hypothetical protein
MNSELELPIDNQGRWPAPIDLRLRVDHGAGAPERGRWSLAPTRHVREVRIRGGWLGEGADAPRVMVWAGFAGRSLEQRCIGVLAVHHFGTADMSPRIVGAPLWQSVSATFVIWNRAAAASQIELQRVAGSQVLLVRRRSGDAPWSERPFALERADADPLRALLRVAWACALGDVPVPASAAAPSGLRMPPLPSRVQPARWAFEPRGGTASESLALG